MYNSCGVAQHSVHPTGGTRRVFKQFVWLDAGSGKMALSPPAHPPVTHTVGRLTEEDTNNVIQLAKRIDFVTYFKDLTPYEYFARHEPLIPRPLNVGWLSSQMPFEKGHTSQEFKDKLLKFCSDEYVVLIARGFHTCEFCGLPSVQWFNEQKDRYGEKCHWASIGDGEIRVLGQSIIYAAPTLIYHYVIQHQYKPPDEFIEAILTSTPDSKEQIVLLSKYSE